MIVVLSVPVFAQDEWANNRRMAIHTNIAPLILGSLLGGFGVEAGFEYAPISSFSTKVNFSYTGFDPSRFDLVEVEHKAGFTRLGLSLFRVNLEGRWYPQKHYLSGWFVGGNAQFYRILAIPAAAFTIDDKEINNGIVDTWSLFATVGYKVVFRSKQRAAFFIEPVLDLGWKIYSDLPDTPFLAWLLGGARVRFNLTLGAAF